MTDVSIRSEAFDWLAKQVEIHGEVLPRELLQHGFVLDGTRIPLVSPAGIFKPQAMSEVPLSITTAPHGPYNDSFKSDGLLLYRYRGEDPNHRDNIGLRTAFRKRIPMVYFHGIVPGKYLAVWPVYIVGDEPGKLTFTVAVDDVSLVRFPESQETTPAVHDENAVFARRQYITRQTRQRLHQQGFRERVLHAYQKQCACCRLRHEELLDAAHIIPDSEPEGEPTVPNGIALCKLHHAAFDSLIIGISPDYIITLRSDVLEEHDGPMLLHGLQGLNNKRILLPKALHDLPDRTLLEKRFERFRRAG